jgi:hypothetical protein
MSLYRNILLYLNSANFIIELKLRLELGSPITKMLTMVCPRFVNALRNNEGR